MEKVTGVLGGGKGRDDFFKKGGQKRCQVKKLEVSRGLSVAVEGVGEMKLSPHSVRGMGVWGVVGTGRQIQEPGRLGAAHAGEEVGVVTRALNALWNDLLTTLPVGERGCASGWRGVADK